MAVAVIVNELDVTDFVEAGSLHWDDQINGRGQLTVRFGVLNNLDGVATGGGTPIGLLLAITAPSGFEPAGPEWRPRDGDEIFVLEDGVRLFGGNLIEPEEASSPGLDLLFMDCTGVEYSAICDRRLVARTYTDQTLKQIVLDIVAQDMGDEGIDTSGVEDGGPVIKKAKWNWESATVAFNDLAELTGMSWWIDQNKVLHFCNRASIAGAPLNNLAVRNGSVRVRRDRQNYRNHQVLRAGAGLTDLRTETFVGDGTRRTFNTAYKMGTEPIVTVNGAITTVGIRQVETGKQWYWNKNVSELSQDQAGAVLTAGDTLSVSYRGLFPIIISAQRGVEVEERKAIEGGSGRYSRVEERANIETIDAAISATQAILDRFGSIGTSITCYTDVAGFAPGQLSPVDFPQHGLTGDYLIESINAEWPAGADAIWYTVKAISGDTFGSWQAYYRRLQKIGREFVINENEVVVGLQEFADAATVTDALVVTSGYPEFRAGIARAGFSVARAA
jgi:hypothetical protein